MEARKGIADRVQISNGRYFQWKKLDHQDPNDYSDQRTWNLLKNIRCNDQDRKTDNANDQGICIYRRNILYKSFHLFGCLDWFYTIRISDSEEILQLADHDGYSDSGSKSGCNSIRDKFDQTSEVTEAHQNKKNTCHHSGNDKSIHSVTGNNTSDDGCKCSGWSGYLYTASAQSGDYKSGYNSSKDTGFRTNTGSKCKCNG